MNELLESSLFFGATLSLFTYLLGIRLKQRWKFPLFNPLLVAVVLCILFLTVFHVDYETYYAGAKYISYLLTPATVCLAIPLYEKLELLADNWKSVLLGILSGVLASGLVVLSLSLLFKLDHFTYVTLLPKSITTAIGMGVEEELGGSVTICVAVIILTGIWGNMTAVGLCKLCRITHPIARGIAIGTSSHAMGTTKAMEMGMTEGAMSSLSIAVAGMFTVVAAPLFALLL